MEATTVPTGEAKTGVAGRGLFYGEFGANGRARVWTESEWDAACAQAKAWGMSVVHPKVAEGTIWWGDTIWLQMLTAVAAKHGLKCFPYHYCYGDTLGPYVATEAAICAKIGNICGGVCPDMEIQWEKAGTAAQQWALDFGKVVRQSFSGPVLPNLFADPSEHAAFPYLQVLSWASGWMPMAYFDEMTSKTTGRQMTAKEASEWLFGEWTILNKMLNARGVVPPPILPIIELGRNLPKAEVTSWLQMMWKYGYCGLWYDGTYAPYAQTVLDAPLPAWSQPAPPPPPPTNGGGTPPPPPPPPPPTGNPKPVLPTVIGLQQDLTTQELSLTWSMANLTIPYDPTDPIVLCWNELTQGAYGIGSPTKAKETITNGYEMQQFEGGRIFSHTSGSTVKVWVQPVSQVRTPGTGA